VVRLQAPNNLHWGAESTLINLTLGPLVDFLPGAIFISAIRKVFLKLGNGIVIQPCILDVVQRWSSSFHWTLETMN